MRSHIAYFNATSASDGDDEEPDEDDDGVGSADTTAILSGGELSSILFVPSWQVTDKSDEVWIFWNIAGRFTRDDYFPSSSGRFESNNRRQHKKVCRLIIEVICTHRDT